MVSPLHGIRVLEIANWVAVPSAAALLCDLGAEVVKVEPLVVGTGVRTGVPLLYDEGSGCVVDLHRYGFASKSTVATLIEQGVDVVTCSTDKLIGATMNTSGEKNQPIAAKAK